MTRRTVPHRRGPAVDAGRMSTEQVHNGGPTPVVLDEAGHVLEPGQTARVAMTARVARLVSHGPLVHLPQTKPARAKKEQE